MRILNKIPTVHIQPFDWGEDTLEVSFMMPNSVTHYYMTEEMVRAFAENIIEELEDSKIIVVSKQREDET